MSAQRLKILTALCLAYPLPIHNNLVWRTFVKLIYTEELFGMQKTLSVIGMSHWILHVDHKQRLV